MKETKQNISRKTIHENILRGLDFRERTEEGQIKNIDEDLFLRSL